MKQTSAELKTMMDHFKDVIRNSGVKVTHQRIEIFRELARTGEHPSIETVYGRVRRRMPTVSLDTVYRALGLFKRLGLVSTLRPLHDRIRFDANMTSHHHFICTRCGIIRDFYDQALDRLDIPASASRLGRVESAHVELRGRCARCSGGKTENGTDGT
ncbi:MAG: transcriptional repressor [Candidatus Aminicenantales bacterium]|jgi:Fur family peroxide stress response transcriptional regulator